MGSINHLGAELLKLKAGNLSSLHVPYKGNSPALQAALSGEVDWLLDTFGTSYSHYRSGKLRYLAICAEKRSTVAPKLPTTADAGLPNVLVSTVNPVALAAEMERWAPIIKASGAKTERGLTGREILRIRRTRRVSRDEEAAPIVAPDVQANHAPACACG